MNKEGIHPMSIPFSDNAFIDYPLIGRQTNDEKIKLLRAIGDVETADELAAHQSTTSTKSIFGIHASHKLKPWEHTSHSFGFLPAATPDNTLLPIFNAAQIEPDKSLCGAAVTIRLDKLRVVDYPGIGIHRILFDFYARNTLAAGTQEHLHYNATFRAQEGQEASTVGTPIFVNLNVGDLGLDFTCNTVNVSNEGSQKALDLLESDIVKAGLQLAKIAQPAVGPLSQIALGLTKAILGANNNVRVQEFRLGLDFENAAVGARLAQGSYFAMQVDDAASWDWSQWMWHPSQARLISRTNPESVCPFNYVMFRVSSQLGK
jgi:hypothetical protein